MLVQGAETVIVPHKITNEIPNNCFYSNTSCGKGTTVVETCFKRIAYRWYRTFSIDQDVTMVLCKLTVFSRLYRVMEGG